MSISVSGDNYPTPPSTHPYIPTQLYSVTKTSTVENLQTRKGKTVATQFLHLCLLLHILTSQLSHIFKDFVVMEVGPEVAPGDQPLSLHHLLPLTSPQVPTLCILPPSSIQDNDYRGRPQPFDLLETAAEELNRRLCSFSLFDEEQWGEFLLELPQLASEDNWLVLEHCHLYSRWREHVEKAAQVCRVFCRSVL